MTISVGEKIPNVIVQTKDETGIQTISTVEIFSGKKVALFGLPGAFTPTCSAKHLPGFVANSQQLKEKGIESIFCVSVNDIFVMNAWGKDQGVENKVMMIADGSADLTKAMGLEVDEGVGFGIRCERFSMVVNDGTVEVLNLESTGNFEITSAEHMLASL